MDHFGGLGHGGRGERERDGRGAGQQMVATDHGASPRGFIVWQAGMCSIVQATGPLRYVSPLGRHGTYNRLHEIVKALLFEPGGRKDRGMMLPRTPEPAASEGMSRGAAERTKMEDIARIAGVSVSTVSRALAGSPRVMGDTRARIEAAVRQTGYVVNQVAQGLRLQRSRQLLVLLPTIANPFFGEIVQGVEEAAQAAGYGVLVGSTEGNAGPEAVLARQLHSV